MSDLILYGSPASTPARAVYWFCLMHNIPFEAVDTALDQMGHSNVIKAFNATGQVPTLRDGDFSLAQMPAILIYLSQKYGHQAMYPDDLRTCARINQYLHFHHSFTRNLSLQLMGTHVISESIIAMMGEAASEGDGGDEFYQLVCNPNKLAIGQSVASQVCALVEASYFPNGSSFLCADHPTIADIACYEEMMAVYHASLFDFADWPVIKGWMERMSELPHHEAAHRYNLTLGDIQSTPNTIERLSAALEDGNAALQECGIKVSALERDAG